MSSVPIKQSVVLSGGFGKSTNSARAGFLPICLARAPIEAFEGISVFMRAGGAEANTEAFTLYCAENVRLTREHCDRLASRGVKFVYIPMAQQSRFRQQTEDRLLEITEDPTMAVSAKSEIIYETSVELVNELLSEPDLANSPRLEKVSRAITTLVLNDPSSFSHLFAASHHDFYTATHMVNVATWMVPLASAMGYHDVDELNHICQAGILHDVGKMFVSSEVLNKRGRLSDAEWESIKRHPELGCEHLAKFERIHPLVHTVTRQHHERLDGTGYPDGLRDALIHPISKICAVVDSFDAMTAFRPFKDRTMSVDDALAIIAKETPQKYDPAVVKAWLNLLRGADSEGIMEAPGEAGGGKNNREFPRFPVNCPARVHVQEQTPNGVVERPGIQVIVHNMSRSGVGFLSQIPVCPDEFIRIYMQGKGSLDRKEEGLVVRRREYRDGWYELGMKYASLQSDLGDTTVSVAA